jgi:hypothetical protein
MKKGLHIIRSILAQNTEILDPELREAMIIEELWQAPNTKIAHFDVKPQIYEIPDEKMALLDYFGLPEWMRL